MRHPTNGLSEDDLSRLTGTSNNTSSSLSTSTNDNENISKIKVKVTEEIVDNKSLNQCEKKLSHSYLPDFIDPNDWPKSSRKRKERNDSASSNNQDRKLVRSNSEEILQSNDGKDVIRRVSSSEDFKPQPLHEIKENVIERSLKTIDENESKEDSHIKSHLPRLETSPARSQRHAPSRRFKDSDEMEYENERRRSSERFCKSRAQSGRKGVVVKRFGIIPKYRNDENIYNAGFVSQFKVEEHGTRKEEAADGEKLHDYNDNNLIDFHVKAESSAEVLPWHTAVDSRCTPNDDQPVLSRRFELMEDGTELLSEHQIITDNEPIKSFRTFHKVDNLKTRELMQKRDSKDAYETPDDRLKAVNKKLLSLKKRLTVCEENYEKKTGYRLSQLDKYNDKHMKSIMTEINKLKKEKQEIKSNPMSVLGLKQSKFGNITKLNDKERVEMIRETLEEIEKKLVEKREESHRSPNLEMLTPEQLVLEKTSVQHALLYFESMYGRPNTKEERDLARNLYERYRLLKRMVARSVQQNSSLGTFGTDLPTIMENEQLMLSSETTTVTPLKNSPESSSPNEGLSISVNTQAPTNQQQPTLPDEDDDEESTTTTTEEATTTKQKPQKSSAFGEKVQTMSVDELWKFLDKTRDEKREVKRTIREFESLFEEQNGRKMLKHDRVFIEETYSNYKELKAKVRLLQALVRKHISH